MNIWVYDNSFDLENLVFKMSLAGFKLGVY